MVADTYSTDGVGVLLMGTGNDNNAWGTNANANVFQIFADAIANPLTSAVTGGTLDLSGTPPPAASSQARYAGLIFTGILASAQSIKVPNLTKWWFVANQTSGAFALTFKTPSGAASTAIPQNSGWQAVYCDGANGIVVWPFNTVQIQMPNGSAAAPPYGFVNETNSGWYRAGTQDVRLAVNGVDVLQITGTGAGSPSIVNVLSPEALQIAGTTIVFPIQTAGIVAGAVTTAKIANAAVTYALIQNVTNARLLGNNSGGAAAVSEISIGSGLSLSGTTLSNPRTTLTTQPLTSGTAATYTTPANCTYIEVYAAGAGGGSSSGTGGDTTFNGVVAKGGSPGSPTGTPFTGGGGGGAGGTAGSGSATQRYRGNAGGNGGSATSGNAGTGGAGGNGGGHPIFGGGAARDTSAGANTGAGAGGSSRGGGSSADGGGGSGEGFLLVIGSPAATYTYTIGVGGTGGSFNGGSGYILVKEFYN